MAQFFSILFFVIFNFYSFANAREGSIAVKPGDLPQRSAFSYDLAPGVGESASFEYFWHLTQTTTATTVEDFLKEWKSLDPDLFRFYLISYRSRSLQSATPEAPRIILFSPVTDFMASFNSHRSQRGSQNIETIRFNHQTDRFEFRELTFDKKNRPTLSEVNPKKCLECHQSLSRQDVDPRPNWEPYFMWPGFFGSVDGKLVPSANHVSIDQRKRMDPILDAVIFEELDHELKWYGKLWETIFPSDARYALLTPFDKAVAEDDAKLYGTHARRELKTSMFTQRVAQNNFKRVARLMLEDRDVFDYIKEALVVSLNCKRTVKLPASFIERHKNNSSLNSFDNFSTLDFGAVLKLFFEPFFFDTDDWSMDFKTNGRLAFSDRFGTPGRNSFEFLAVLQTQSQEFKKLKEMNCNEDFLKLLKKYEDPQLFQELQNKRRHHKARIEAIKQAPLIQRCINCHSSPTTYDIPEIAFNDRARLQKQLTKGGYKHGNLASEILHRIGPHANSNEQMPPQGLPTEKQRQDLIVYIKGLMAEDLRRTTLQ